jgi:hypothetical protein
LATNQASSSILIFNAFRVKFKIRKIQAALWIVFYLAIIDMAVSIIFKFPDDPQKKAPSTLQGYFEYGRSIEGKFKKMAFAAQLQVDPTLGYGWLKKKKGDNQPVEAGSHQILIAAYGMSHTVNLIKAMAKIDSKYLIRSICAPGAPVNWGFTAYDLDKEKNKAQIVIWGIMTDNIPFIDATLGANIYFDLGHPYTFPRYYVDQERLIRIDPPFLSEEGFQEYKNNKVKWNSYIEWLKKNDRFYDAFLFKKNITDNSALFRVIRRAYAQIIHEREFNSVLTKDGFRENSHEIITLRRMVAEFAESVRAQNKIPVIFIVNNRNCGDYLYKALKPILDTKKIPYLSSHVICPPDDPRSYLGDGHFVPEKDNELAKEMIRLIDKERFTSKLNKN